MSRVAIVARNTFREAVRDRVLYNLVFFALLMIAASILVGEISIGIETSVIVSLGLSAISLIGLLIAVFIGVGLVYKEMDKRTLYALLSKPLKRREFLIGKFGGLVLTLAVNTAAMGAGLFVSLLYVRHWLERGDMAVLVAVYFIWLKLAIVVSLALLFSCFTTPLLAILFTAGLYISGLFAVEIRTFHSAHTSAAAQWVFTAISYALPNFENFDVMAAAAHGRHIPGMLVLHNTLYTIVYCAAILAVSAAVFSRRNLK